MHCISAILSLFLQMYTNWLLMNRKVHFKKMAEVSLASLLVCLSLTCWFLIKRKDVWNKKKTRLFPNLACLAASASLWNVVSWSTEKMFETKRDCSPILRAFLPLPVPLFEMLLPDQQKRCTRSYKKKTRLFPQSCMPYCLEASVSLWNAVSWSRQAALSETIFIAANQLVHNSQDVRK